MRRNIGVLLLAHGAAASLEEIPDYLRRIFGERPVSAELVRDIQERYRLIGGRSPLLELTRAQARSLGEALNARDNATFHVHIGMRNSSPTIAAAIGALAHLQPESVVALPMTPYYSRLGVGAYQQQVEKILAEMGACWKTLWAQSWNMHALLIEAFANKIRTAIKTIPELSRSKTAAILSAHSLPSRILEGNDPYPAQVEATAKAVAQAAGLAHWRLAYQSQGAGARAGQSWLGPGVSEVMRDFKKQDFNAILLAPIGFISDHLETLYDDDIFYRKEAESLRLHFARAQALNDDPLLMRALTDIVLSRLRSP